MNKPLNTLLNNIFLYFNTTEWLHQGLYISSNINLLNIMTYKPTYSQHDHSQLPVCLFSEII